MQEKYFSPIGDGQKEKQVVSVNETKISVKNPKAYKIDATRLSPLIQDLRTKLDEYVIGQESAKDELCDALARTLIKNPNRKTPIATLMFPGPTGVGKTDLVRALYKILFGDDSIDIGRCKIDSSLFNTETKLTTLNGASPEYVGRDQTPILSSKVIFEAYRKALKNNTLHPLLQRYDEEFGILLLDEFEKGGESYQDLFLHIFDEGIHELNVGADSEDELGKNIGTGGKNTKKINFLKTTKFRNVLIIMTSNLGQEKIQKKLSGKGNVGFKTKSDGKVHIDKVFYVELIKNENTFRPEFANRLTEIIPFQPLSKEEFYKVLALNIRKHNKTFAYTGIKIKLTSQTKNHLVSVALDSNQGGRKMIRLFEHDIYTLFVRAINNGEIDKIEMKTGKTVKYIVVDYIDENYDVYVEVDKDKKALNKELKEEALLRQRKKNLNQQEVIISLKDDSLLLTMRDIIFPSIQYYSVLLKEKEKLMPEFEEELQKTRAILESYGLQEADFGLLRNKNIQDKYQSFEKSFKNAREITNFILLWDENDKIYSFNGMFKYVDKYVKNFFNNNKDLKALVKGGAGSLDDVRNPIIDFASKLVQRELTSKEDEILVKMIHKEYIKLSSTMPANKQIEHKKKEDTKKIVGVSKEKTPAVNITMNFYGDEKENSLEDKLKNLFEDDFEVIIQTINQSIQSKEDMDNISDIIVAIRGILEFEKKFLLDDEQMLTITKLVIEMLEKEQDPEE